MKRASPGDDKDVIYIYTFRFRHSLQEIEGDALGQLWKGGELSEDQLKDLAKKSSPLPDAPKASKQR